MLIRKVAKLGVSLVAAITAIVLMSAPASAGQSFNVYQYRSTGPDTLAGVAAFVAGGTSSCSSDAEMIEVYDYPGGFGIEAQVYVRPNADQKWQWIEKVRVWDGLKRRCLSIKEGMRVKLSTWQYASWGKWGRVSGFGTA